MKSTTIVQVLGDSFQREGDMVVDVFDSGCVAVSNPLKPIIFRRNLLSLKEGGDGQTFIKGVPDETATHRHYGFIQFNDEGIVSQTVSIILPVGEEENDIGAVLSEDQNKQELIGNLFEVGDVYFFLKEIRALANL